MLVLLSVFFSCNGNKDKSLEITYDSTSGSYIIPSAHPGSEGAVLPYFDTAGQTILGWPPRKTTGAMLKSIGWLGAPDSSSNNIPIGKIPMINYSSGSKNTPIGMEHMEDLTIGNLCYSHALLDTIPITLSGSLTLGYPSSITMTKTYDTIPVLLLVSDTTKESIFFGSGITYSTNPFSFHIRAFSVRKYAGEFEKALGNDSWYWESVYTHEYYIDENKKRLDKSIVVWQEKELKTHN